MDNAQKIAKLKKLPSIPSNFTWVVENRYSNQLNQKAFFVRLLDGDNLNEVVAHSIVSSPLTSKIPTRFSARKIRATAKTILRRKYVRDRLRSTRKISN